MAILWAGAEDIDFPNGATVSVATDTSYFDSAWNRCVLYTAADGVAYSNAFLGGAVTEAWLHLKIRVNNGWNNNWLFAGLSNTSQPGSGVWFGYNGNGCRLSIETRTASGTRSQKALQAAATHTNDQHIVLDLHLEDYNSTSGVATLYQDGYEILTITPQDLRTDSLADLNCVAFIGHNPFYGYNAPSQFIVADEDTRAMKLRTMAPNGDSPFGNDWTNSYGAIDEQAKDDNDTMYSNTNDQVGRVALLNTPTGNYSVKAVVLSARATRSSDATPTNIALGVRTGSVDYPGSDQALTTGWATYQAILSANPGGGNWTTSQLDSLELLMKARA